MSELFRQPRFFDLVLEHCADGGCCEGGGDGNTDRRGKDDSNDRSAKTDNDGSKGNDSESRDSRQY